MDIEVLTDADRMQVTLRVVADELVVRTEEDGTSVTMANSLPVAPGSPALPMLTFAIALPAGLVVSDLSIGPISSDLVAAGPVAVAQWSALASNDHDGPAPDSFAPLRQPADQRAFERAGRWLESPAKVLHIDRSGPLPIATVAFHPVAIAPEDQIVLHTETVLALRLTDHVEASPMQAHSRGQVSSWIESSFSSVVNQQVGHKWNLAEILAGDAESIIITDDYRWPEHGKVRGDPLPFPGIVGEFERLAEHHRKHRESTRVVTVSEIVAGEYAHVTGHCRDVPEAIRTFLQWAHRELGTARVLLAGGQTVVPARRLFGWGNTLITRRDVVPTQPCTSRYVDDTPPHLDIFMPGIDHDAIICDTTFGQVIPSARSFPGSPTRWQFMQPDFTTPAILPSGCVRVEGPRALLQLDFFIVNGPEADVASDLYYSAITPRVGQPQVPGAREWDDNDNGFFGQYGQSNDINGGLVDHADYTPILGVGRAPVETTAEARAFVDKVIDYEDAAFGHDWARRVVYAQDNLLPDVVGVLDPFAETAEETREQLRRAVPYWSDVRRYYADAIDVATLEGVPLHSPLAPLGPTPPSTITSLAQHLLSDGAHIVIMCGHGNTAGTCGFGDAVAQSTSGSKMRLAIAYASACATAEADRGEFCRSVQSIGQPDGVVAYIGYARTCVSSSMSRVHRMFWERVHTDRPRLGSLASNVYRGLLGAWEDDGKWHNLDPQLFWALYAFACFGDPGMRLWTSAPIGHPLGDGDLDPANG